MKQKYALTILFALIIASGLTSIGCYQATERIVAEDMECALTKALAEQQSDAITPDTIGRLRCCGPSPYCGRFIASGASGARCRS